MTWGFAWNVVTDIGGLALLFGVFYRLGAVQAALAGIGGRVVALENWRNGLRPMVPRL